MKTSEIIVENPVKDIFNRVQANIATTKHMNDWVKPKANQAFNDFTSQHSGMGLPAGTTLPDLIKTWSDTYYKYKSQMPPPQISDLSNSSLTKLKKYFMDRSAEFFRFNQGQTPEAPPSPPSGPSASASSDASASAVSGGNTASYAQPGIQPTRVTYGQQGTAPPQTTAGTAKSRELMQFIPNMTGNELAVLKRTVDAALARQGSTAVATAYQDTPSREIDMGPAQVIGARPLPSPVRRLGR